MTSIILHTATRVLVPMMLGFSIVVLLIGHNEPGGGFVGGLIAAAACSLYALAHDGARAQQYIGVDGHTLIGGGLLCAAIAALISMTAGLPLFTGTWTELGLPLLGKVAIGTPLLFDLGVYLVVAGVGLLMILPLVDD